MHSFILRINGIFFQVIEVLIHVYNYTMKHSWFEYLLISYYTDSHRKQYITETETEFVKAWVFEMKTFFDGP